MVADAAKPRKPRRPDRHAWPLEHELAVRRLYLIERRGASEIALTLKLPGRTPQSIRNLICARGWTPEREKSKANVRKRAEIEITARAEGEVQRVVDATAALAESASISSLEKARQAAEGGAALDVEASRAFRAWAAGARDLVSVARVSRGLDARGVGAANGEGNGPTVNLQFFVGNIGAGAGSVARGGEADTCEGAMAAQHHAQPGVRECKTVGPVVEVEASAVVVEAKP